MKIKCTYSKCGGWRTSQHSGEDYFKEPEEIEVPDDWEGKEKFCSIECMQYYIAELKMNNLPLPDWYYWHNNFDKTMEAESGHYICSCNYMNHIHPGICTKCGKLKDD